MWLILLLLTIELLSRACKGRAIMFLPASVCLRVCLSAYLLPRYLKNGWLNHYQTFRILLLDQLHKLIRFWWSCDQMPPTYCQNTKMFISLPQNEILTWNLVCCCLMYIPNRCYKQEDISLLFFHQAAFKCLHLFAKIQRYSYLHNQFRCWLDLWCSCYKYIPNISYTLSDIIIGSVAWID